MRTLPYAERCRMSGEPLDDAEVLFELASCPLAGVYPGTAEDARDLRTPLRVVQARGSGLVQLAHRLDPDLYRRYAFAGGTSAGYPAYLEAYADRVARSFAPEAAVLEVGCGDGTLLEALARRGFRDLLGVDPSLAVTQPCDRVPVVRGYFPADLSPAHRDRRFDLIILRHVLEHIESPMELLRAFAERLRPSGQLWIEVPDLESTIRRELWSNFYQLHCNYFEGATLDALLARAGFACLGGELVDVFGGSLHRRYCLGDLPSTPAPTRWGSMETAIARFRVSMCRVLDQLPPGSAGYGAAERTAVTIGLCPELGTRLTRLYDGNPGLAHRYLAGTELRIDPPAELVAQPPAGLLLFALSHREEILRSLRGRLPGDLWVGVGGDDFACRPLGSYS